jgi:hypothetical protein
MAINPKDDYESLARLLYPSIEASGNVYYGQTRKLTMDEILGKNGLGFESHIESVKVDSNSADYGFTYDSYFCWKLGSLKGSIKVILGVNDKTADTFPDASKIILRTASGDTIIKDNTESNSRAMNGTAYACYMINSESKKVENNLRSGVYNTYEKEMSVQFDCICVTESDINPADVTKPVEDIENRNFFFNYDDCRLYVKVCSGSINNHITDDSESSSVDVWGLDSHTFRIKAIDGDIKVSYSVHGTNNNFIDNFRMAYRTEPNEGRVVLQPNESIIIESGKSVAFELYDDPEHHLTPNRLPIISDGDLIFSSKWPTMTVTDELPDQETLDNNLAYAQFHMSKVNQSSNAHVKLIGRLGDAFGDQNADHPSCAVFANLFKDCTLITELDDNFILDYFGPRDIEYAYYRFYQTFSGCTGLTKASICTKHLYNNMFVKTYKDCVNVKEVKFDIGSSDYELEASEDNTFSGCDQSDCIYTVALFNDEYQKRHSYLNFDENLYITARSMVPQYWHLDNGWLLFVRDAAVNTTTININIANSITWTSQSESTLDKNHLFQYIYSDSDDFVNDWQWLNTNTGVEFTGDHNRGIFIRLRTDVTFNRRYNGDIINFTITSSSPDECSIKAYGSIRSLRGQLHLSSEIKNFEFAHLFENCTLLTRAPSIDRFSPFMADLDYEDSEFSDYEFGCYAFSYMFHGCTSLLEFPKISAWCLAKGAFSRAFNGCTSLSNITKMSDWFDSDLIPGYYYALPAVIGSGVFSGMFEGCTSLRSVPEILFSGSKPSSYWGEAPIFENNTIPARTYYETFSGCRSLRTLLASGISSSDFSNNQFKSTMEGITDYYRCVFFTDQDNIDWKGLQYIPEKWALAGENKFNCRLLESDGEFKSGLIVASGTDSKKNGRGLVTSKSTNANMLQSSPMISDNPPKMDAYDRSNGQYNQDIWGIKCFNSPVIFRNGIYDECSCLIAGNISTIKFQTEVYYVTGGEPYVSSSGTTNIYRRKEQDSVLEPTTGKSAMWINNLDSTSATSGIKLCTAYRNQSDNLSFSQASIISSISSNTGVDKAESLSKDTPYVQGASGVRSVVFESNDSVEYGIYDEVDGWTPNRIETKNVKNYMSSLSADKAHILVSTVDLDNESRSNIMLSADEVTFSGIITNLIPHTAALSGTIPIGGITIIRIDRTDLAGGGLVNDMAVAYKKKYSNTIAICNPYVQRKDDHLPIIGSRFDEYEDAYTFPGSMHITDITGHYTYSESYISEGQVFQPLCVPTLINDIDDEYVHFYFLAIRVK